MSICPCCSNLLLRHIRQGTLYWLCRSCWAEMPNFEEDQSTVTRHPILNKQLRTNSTDHFQDIAA
jgi:DNA-directed RNA polymerase subunit M/transcription elongation factor TFIIS